MQLTLVWNEVSIKDAKEAQLLVKVLKQKWVDVCFRARGCDDGCVMTVAQQLVKALKQT